MVKTFFPAWAITVKIYPRIPSVAVITHEGKPDWINIPVCMNSLPSIWVEQKRSYNFCLPNPQNWCTGLYPEHTALLWSRGSHRPPIYRNKSTVRVRSTCSYIETASHIRKLFCWSDARFFSGSLLIFRDWLLCLSQKNAYADFLVFLNTKFLCLKKAPMRIILCYFFFFSSFRPMKYSRF